MTPERNSASMFTTWSLLHQSYSLVYKNLDQLMTKTGISQAQASVLVVLKSVGRPLPLSKLARLLVQEAQSVTSLVDRLESRGLVRRVPDSKDRRVINVELTPDGESLFDRIYPAAHQGISEIFAGLNPRELHALTDSLRKLRNRGADVLHLSRSPFEDAEKEGVFEPPDPVEARIVANGPEV
ncbi:MAG: MarR family winged helix-turn-helix transcriptional regulator [Dehalococcoidia bacterium]